MNYGTYTNLSANTNNTSYTIGSSQQGKVQSQPHPHSTSYTPGQQLSGTIVDLHNNQITLSLSDGTSLTGSLEQASSHSIGDQVTLSVTDVNGKTISLKFIETTSSHLAQSTIDKALEAASLTKTKKNQLVIKALLTHQMSIDKNTIQTLLRQMATHNTTDINTLLHMQKYSIPITETSIATFTKTLGMEHNIHQEMDDFMSTSLNAIKDSLLKETSLENSSNAIKRLIDVSVSSTNSGVEVSSESNSLLSKDISTMDSSLSVDAKDAFPQSSTKDSGISPLDTSSKEPLLSLSHSSINEQELVDSTIVPLDTSIESNSSLGSHLALEDRISLLNTLKILPFDPQMSNSIIDGTISVHQLLQHIKNELGNLDSKNLVRILSSKEFIALLTDTFKKTWSLSPEQIKKMESSNDNDNLFTHMKMFEEETSQLNKLLDSSNTTNSYSSDTSHSKQFMNHFQELFHYLPLPLKLSKDASGELYVYKRKKSNNSEQGTTVLLHLNMEHLGPTDIHIELKDKSLKNQFYFDSKKTCSLVEDAIQQLDDLLSEQGYLSTSIIHVREENSTPIKEKIESTMNQSPNLRYNFDLRV